MVSFARIMVLMASALVVSACMTMPTAFDFGETSEFDGTWSGRLMLSIGEASCLRRTPITVKIQNGSMDGKTTYKNFDARLTGFISEAGMITNGKVEVKNNFYNYEIEGNFEGETGNGTWKSKKCAGKWDLRRIRKTVS